MQESAERLALLVRARVHTKFITKELGTVSTACDELSISCNPTMWSDGRTGKTSGAGTKYDIPLLTLLHSIYRRQPHYKHFNDVMSIDLNCKLLPELGVYFTGGVDGESTCNCPC